MTPSSNDSTSPAIEEADRKPQRRERAKEEKLRRIKDAARALFSEKGFENASTTEIADRADIGAGTLYLYVSTKEDLLAMVFIDDVLVEFNRAYKRAPKDRPLVEQLLAFFSDLIEYHMKDADLSRHFLREMGIARSERAEAEINRIMRAVNGRVRDLITAAQASGEVWTDMNPDLATRVAFACYYHVLIGRINMRLNREEAVAELQARLEIIMCGLSARR